MLFLDIHPEKMKTLTCGVFPDTCSLMFIAALFTITKTWKQVKCPPIDEWIKIFYTHNGVLVIKRMK